MLIVMFFMLATLEMLPPFKRQIFHGFPGHESDVEIWRWVGLSHRSARAIILATMTAWPVYRTD